MIFTSLITFCMPLSNVLGMHLACALMLKYSHAVVACLASAIALYNNRFFPPQMTPNSTFNTMAMVSRLMASCFLQSWLLIVHDEAHMEICRIGQLSCRTSIPCVFAYSIFWLNRLRLSYSRFNTFYNVKFNLAELALQNC